MNDWRTDFQYLLNRKMLSKNELDYLCGQIKSIIDRESKNKLADVATETIFVIRAAVDIIMNSVVETIGLDGHTWSDRPCQTCLAITGLIGRPYGCYWYQEKKKKESAS